VRRHEIDVFSLVMGLLFVGAALIFGVSDDPGGKLDGWPLPALLISVGAIGLIAAVTRHRDS
jgi:hypothetical protein